jgi:hypothetical protein
VGAGAVAALGCGAVCALAGWNAIPSDASIVPHKMCVRRRWTKAFMLSSLSTAGVAPSVVPVSNGFAPLFVTSSNGDPFHDVGTLFM